MPAIGESRNYCQIVIGEGEWRNSKEKFVVNGSLIKGQPLSGGYVETMKISGVWVMPFILCQRLDKGHQARDEHSPTWTQGQLLWTQLQGLRQQEKESVIELV